jgi:two-component system phosphate regulon sensor histidine kinase PhoR
MLGDRDELVRVFENLVENALKYGGSDRGIDIVCAAALREDGTAEAVVSVVDYGPGIASEHLPRLTERFYRIDVPRSREQGGTGLGLAIVKHIVNRHRGRLLITSEVGRGTTFSIRLNLANSTLKS